MTVVVELPGAAALELDHLLLDINGTLTRDGRLLDGVADTFGTAEAIAEQLGAQLALAGLLLVDRRDTGAP